MPIAKENVRTWTVYIHINKINNKKYIGITRNNVKERWKNGNGYKTQTVFYNAIQKYGWDNFEHKILFTNLNKEEAISKEKFLIKYYNTYVYNNNSQGYNMTLGADGCLGENKILKEKFKGKGNPMYGKKAEDFMTPEAIAIKNQRLSKSLTGRKLSEEHKKKLSESKKGSKLSEETKRKMSESQKMYAQNHKEEIIKRNKKSGDTRKGIRFTEERKNNISNALKGKIAKGKHPNAKKTICEGIIFDCALDCANFYNINPTTMRSWLNKTNKMPQEWEEKGLMYYYEQ